MTWPEIYSCQVNVQDRDGMRLRDISFRKWGEEDVNLGGLRLNNCRGQFSDTMGKTRHDWETIVLNHSPIEKI